MRPKLTWALALSLAAAFGAGCGGPVLSDPEQAMPGAEHASRRMPGSTVRMMLGGDRVYLRLYNLTEAEREKWAEKIFRNIRYAITGAPAEQERRGRGK